MREIKRNYKISVKGIKIGNTYIHALEENRFYPIVRTKLTKSISNNKLFYWVLKRWGTKWKVLTIINIF